MSKLEYDFDKNDYNFSHVKKTYYTETIGVLLIVGHCSNNSTVLTIYRVGQNKVEHIIFIRYIVNITYI